MLKLIQENWNNLCSGLRELLGEIPVIEPIYAR